MLQSGDIFLDFDDEGIFLGSMNGSLVLPRQDGVFSVGPYVPGSI